MKFFQTFIASVILLASLVSCGESPYDGSETYPPATVPTATSNVSETTAEITEETTVPKDPNAPSHYTLTYLDKIQSPIASSYSTENLQWRIGDGTKRYFTVISRVYNHNNFPIVISETSLSLKVENVFSQNILKKITPYYLMPYQTGFVVVQSNTDLRTSVKLSDVDYSYSITTAPAQNAPTQYYAESANATVEHRGSFILSVQFDIVMRDPPETRFVQINGVLYNKDGIAVDAFSRKLTQRNGMISFTHFPDMNFSPDDIAFYSFTMTSQCNE